MPLSHDELKTALRLACDWLVDVAQVATRELTVEKNSMRHPYSDWRGAIRGEYSAATRQWDFFCPVWHTGQAVKALLGAAQSLNEPRYRQAADAGAAFILDKQVWDTTSPDHGLILAFEDSAEFVNTSAVLECMDGLLRLADANRAPDVQQRLVRAGEFLIEKLYMPDAGLFHDAYHPGRHAVVLPNPFRTRENVGGRPLLDDSIFLKLYRQTGETRFRDVQVRVSETLVQTQRPRGNWVDYAPCNPDRMRFHPRHTYWWGLPLLDTYRETGRGEFLETAVAAGEFTLRALRSDGGYFREVSVEPDGTVNTASFGHATSGAACGALLFLALHRETGDARWLEGAERALSFCLSMQMRTPQDPNLKGVIIEKVLPPRGTDASPYHVRDLGTIFFIQAAVAYLGTPGRR
ncbi:MAG: hypothetical protein A3K19_07640 [Lentisphaerae bacterium RIFOXYB12_FULL_65_16]|nr:MAG: hypothetical protein A3K18_07500 [Lentisphaerae bacterium RIFOXYA12_64_32]OGV87521.1 MAG: hypothetical protein A3K19_07640 [Lentisphaerae bacterium RIFOXYB12_FULL_65_16]